MITPATHSHGYLVVNFSGSMQYVHRLVASVFFGASNLQVNHKDLDKMNNRVDNLEFVTNSENSLHAFRSGVKVGKTKLTKKQREEVRILRKAGARLKTLAKQFSVSETAISEIARGTTWKWE